jgi:carbon-monoxide dehydrogenase small subunit
MGAVQCGFCTPGMLLSAKALLDTNPDPTRDEVRHALAGNLCRCTGYVKIVDAVLAAAAAMRSTEGDAGAAGAAPEPGAAPGGATGGPAEAGTGLTGGCVAW